MVVPDQYVPLAADTRGCLLDSETRKIQNGSRVYHVSLKQEYLELLGLCEQGAETKHAVAYEGQVTVAQPAYIIQPAGVVE